MDTSAHALVVGFVAAQRLAELVYARRNTERLVAKGATVVEEPGYLWIVLVHAGWLAALAFAIPDDAPVWLPFLMLYGAIFLFRLWVMASLGRCWTTRIVTLAEAPLADRGPYRWIRHPNYLVVAAEIFVVPMIFGAWEIAVVASLANAAVLWRRIALEDQVLEARRQRRPADA